VRLGPIQNLELLAGLGRLDVDARGGEPGDMLGVQRRVDHVDRLLAALEALVHEGQQRPVLLVARVEERADVAASPERAPGEVEGLRLGLDHTSRLGA
jgi:hypothetical protein